MDECTVRCLYRIPRIMQQGKAALRDTKGSGTALNMLRLECWMIREELKDCIESLRIRWSIAEAAMASKDVNARPSGPMYALCGRVYALGLMTAVVVNILLADLGEQFTYLHDESVVMAHEIIEIARSLSGHRPLGSSSMVMCLGAAWITLRDTDSGDEAMELLGDYLRVLPVACAIPSGLQRKDLECLVKRFSLVD
jgi:hypothetical protein